MECYLCFKMSASEAQIEPDMAPANTGCIENASTYHNALEAYVHSRHHVSIPSVDCSGGVIVASCLVFMIGTGTMIR